MPVQIRYGTEPATVLVGGPATLPFCWPGRFRGEGRRRLAVSPDYRLAGQCFGAAASVPAVAPYGLGRLLSVL